MSSVRKRKTMLKKLHIYFKNKGGLVGEREYSQDYTAPYRLATIDKFLGGWTRMVYYLGFYYPEWKTPPTVEKIAPKVEKPVEEAPKSEVDPLEALRSKKAKSDENE